MKKVLFLFVLLYVIMVGCKENSLMHQLVEIDSIANRESDKKALFMLEKIIPESIDDEESLAYYWLLKYRTEIRLQHDIKSIESLEIPIKYYNTVHDKGKLARAYGYLGTILENHGKLKEASIAYKQAESLINENSDELHLIHHIYLSLTHINISAQEKELAAKYGKLTLKKAYQIGNKYDIAYATMSLFVLYANVEMNDSAQYYLDTCIPLIEFIPLKQRAPFYDNIGISLIDKDIMTAEKYLMKAFSIQPSPHTCQGLARIYYKRGEKEKAHEMWGKALQTDNKRLKVEVLQTLYDIQRDEGDYKKASETAMQIVALKDSIAQREKEENIRGIQEQYEIEHQAMAEKARTNMIIYLTASLLFLAVALATYLYYRMTKGRQELKEVRKQLEQHRLQLKVLEQEGKTDTKEVENLKQKISELQTKQGALLQNGRERYEEMMAGGTTIRWSRNDFMDAVEYYRTVDADFINHMEQDYKHLSSKYIFFSLLEHLGKTDEELQHIMAISQNTIRSYRSRINHSLIQG